jgi:hypothetical protein
MPQWLTCTHACWVCKRMSGDKSHVFHLLLCSDCFQQYGLPAVTTESLPMLPFWLQYLHLHTSTGQQFPRGQAQPSAC